uniref:Adenylyl-sulfate kinase n=1 Tax=Curvibacter symbiont subsp. Hydra magnipapillata TaxID=667019 RepID=C9Y8X1_CURXX|nr:Adenylyl-sulfate kinase [Curvibacter putative symbiont of Hydra magnipapillata]
MACAPRCAGHSARPVQQVCRVSILEDRKPKSARGVGVMKPCCFWMTGLSGAGKTTLAHAMRERVNADGVVRLVVLDGDEVRASLCKDLGFSAADRQENSRRLAAMARLLVDAGLVVVVSAISPYRAARESARSAFVEGTFWEVHVATPLQTCMARDVKGLYRKAREGSLGNLTGVGADYEEPLTPDIRVLGEGDIHEAVSLLLDKLGLDLN